MLVALVGKTNVGKSSFFKASTMIDVEISNRIFCTIKPNHGIAYVTAPCPCKELNVKCEPNNSKCVNGVRLIPIELWDVAGLIPGAHEGKGLGNAFLSDIIRGDVLIHVIDVSGTTDSGGNPTNDYDPANDVKFLEEEIDLWFEAILEKNLVKIRDKGKAQDVLAGLGIKKEHLSIVEEVGLNDIPKLAKELRKKSKPIIVGANKIDVKGAKDKFDKIKSEFDLTIVPCSAESEIALRGAAKSGLIEYIPGSSDFKIIGEMSDNQKKALAFIKENVLKKYGSTGVQDCLNKAIFDFLECVVVYPVVNEHKFTDKKGKILPDAYLLPKGSTAHDLAYKIHQDIGKNFIGAIDAKSKKRIGGDYILQNGDIIKIQSAGK